MSRFTEIIYFANISSCMVGRNIGKIYILSKPTHSLSFSVVLRCFYLQILLMIIDSSSYITEFVGLHSKYDKTKYASLATNLVLAIYSCSLLQFVFVTTSTTYEYTESEKQAVSYTWSRNADQILPSSSTFNDTDSIVQGKVGE